MCWTKSRPSNTQNSLFENTIKCSLSLSLWYLYRTWKWWFILRDSLLWKTTSIDSVYVNVCSLFFVCFSLSPFRIILIVRQKLQPFAFNSNMSLWMGAILILWRTFSRSNQFFTAFFFICCNLFSMIASVTFICSSVNAVRLNTRILSQFQQ